MKNIIILALLVLVFIGCELPPLNIAYSFTYEYHQISEDKIQLDIDLSASSFSGIETLIFSFEGDEILGNHFGFDSPAITLDPYYGQKEIHLTFKIGVLNNPAIISNLQITRIVEK